MQAVRDPQMNSATEHAAANGSSNGVDGSMPAAAASPRPVLHASSWEQVSRAAPQVFPRKAPVQMPNRLRVFSGTSNPSLSQEVACYLGMDLGNIKIKRFADGEIYVQVCSARAAEVVSPPARLPCQAWRLCWVCFACCDEDICVSARVFAMWYTV